MVSTWKRTDENGSINWRVYSNKLSVFFYFNVENIDLDELLKHFNDNSREFNLPSAGWKLPFKMQKSDAEGWNYDYFKRVETVCCKIFFKNGKMENFQERFTNSKILKICFIFVKKYKVTMRKFFR